MDLEAPSTKNFILVWIKMKICKPLENCLGLEMIWKLSFNSEISRQSNLGGRHDSNENMCNYEEIIDTIYVFKETMQFIL